jgi:RAT1-interacting protein
VSDHDGAFPHFSNPQHIGEFSLDKQRQVVADRSQLKYLNKRSVNEHPIEMDLNDGYRRFEQKDPLQQETLDTFLQWIMLTSKMNVPLRTGNSDDENIRVLLAVVHDADIVCWRGALTKIAATPYEQREGWRMACIRHAGVIFICEYRTQEKRRSIENMTAKEKLMSYWGVKFEQYMTTTAIAHTQVQSGHSLITHIPHYRMMHRILGRQSTTSNSIASSSEVD